MSAEICEECRVGRYRETTVPYMHRLGSRMLTFPDAPALVCDVCKHVHYDAQFLHSMDYVLSRLAHAPTPRQRARAQALQEEGSGWQPSRR